MKSVDYKCKMCGRAGRAEFDELAGTTDIIQKAVDKLFPILTCDRCHDFKTAGRVIFERIIAAADKLDQARNARLADAEAVQAGKIERLACKYAEKAARYMCVKAKHPGEAITHMLSQPHYAVGILKRWVIREYQPTPTTP